MNLSATLKSKFLYFIALACLLSTMAAIAAPVNHYKVVARYPHATSSYTEGLFYLDGIFYEGTGLEGQSALLAVQPETGQILQRVDLPPQYFGEGIVNWGRISTSGLGNRTFALSTTAFLCASSSSSHIQVRVGA